MRGTVAAVMTSEVVCAHEGTSRKELVERLRATGVKRLPVVDALKFAMKRGLPQLDYRVLPLEGLWWVPDMSRFSIDRKGDWDWTMMIRQSEEADEALLEQAVRTATSKKDLPAAGRLRLEGFAEGLAAQVMHTVVRQPVAVAEAARPLGPPAPADR